MKMPSIAKQFLNGFRNSIGDISLPEYADQSRYNVAIEISLWVWFFLYEFFMLVILLNFLIA